MSATMRLYLGIDGGGSKTAAAIVDAAGVERGRGHGGPCNIATGDDDALRAAITDARAGALAAGGLAPDTRFAAVCAGVAGYTAKRRRADLHRLLARHAPADGHRVEPDFAAAWWGATGGEPGLVVIAGTGAVVYARNGSGQACRVDGRGYLLGDRGSGFDLGRWALAYTLRRLDDGSGPDALAAHVLSAIGASDGDELVEWVYRDFSPGRVASLAASVGAWADEVPLAARFVESAGFALHTAAARALRRLAMPPDTTPVYTLGGLWLLGERLVRAFRLGNPRSGGGGCPGTPFADVRAPLHDAAYGAALLAMREAD